MYGNFGKKLLLISLKMNFGWITRSIIVCMDGNSVRLLIFKQYVVTNCSKERPGSIVTETLKNGIFVTIVTSKELHFE